MSDTTTKASDVGQMTRMKDLAEINPDIWRYAFTWLAGVGRIRPEMSKDIDKAIDYVERTFPL